MGRSGYVLDNSIYRAIIVAVICFANELVLIATSILIVFVTRRPMDRNIQVYETDTTGKFSNLSSSYVHHSNI